MGGWVRERETGGNYSWLCRPVCWPAQLERESERVRETMGLL